MTARLRIAIAPAACAILMLTQTAAVAEPTTRYVIRRGDTLYDLAAAYMLTIDDYRLVQKRNHIANPRRLRIGGVLKVPTGRLRTTLIKAQLGAYRGEVTIDTAGGPLKTAPGVMFGEGGVISTGANSFARLDLPDRSRLALPSQSRVRIVRLRQTLLTSAIDREFVVEAGRSESSVTPLRNPQDRYIVRTPISVSAVRGTEFRVSYGEQDHRAATEVLKGIVAVSGDSGSSALIAASYGVSMTPGDAAAPAPLPATPTLRNPGRLQDARTLSFEVIAADEAAKTVGYRAQLAADAGFLDVLAETASDAPQLTLPAPADGTYFVRVSSINDAHLESLPATYAFERILNILDADAPVMVSKRGHMRNYLFRWEATGEGSRSFRFQLSRSGGEATPFIDAVGLSDRQITVTDLPPGAYSWRVMSRTFNHGRYLDKWSPAQQFKIGG